MMDNFINGERLLDLWLEEYFVEDNNDEIEEDLND
jgi:hypothetical protein